MFWGFSEAMDLYQEYVDAFIKQLTNMPESTHAENETSKDNVGEGDEQQTAGKEDAANAEPGFDRPRNLNILLYGDNDPRHVIKTMAKLYKHKIKSLYSFGDIVEYQTPTINFYVFEVCPEAFARYTALLGIALEHAESIDIGNKVHLFMDVYGNSLLRPSSSQYLESKAPILTKMISDEKVLKKLAPMLDIKRLKENERKAMENAYRFWLPTKPNVFDIKDLWTMRIKQSFGDRYNYRQRTYSKDLMMTLWERNAKRICLQEYCEWRETGIAFRFPDYEQSQPNKTLHVELEKYLRCDTHTGPFCTFGLRTTDERMMQSAYSRATDITAASLTELLYELQHRQPYQHDQGQSCKHKLDQLRTANECKWDARLVDCRKPWIHVDGTRVHFLSSEEIFSKDDLAQQWKGFFDVVFVGQLCNNALNQAFAQVLKPNALLVVETNLLTLAPQEIVTELGKTVRFFAKHNKLFGELKCKEGNTNYPVLKFKKVKGG